MAYCTSCGSEVTNEMFFCPKCGCKLMVPTATSENNKSDDYATDSGVNKRENIVSRRIKKSKLYEQWVKHAGLPVEEISSTIITRDMPVKGKARHPYLLYMLLVIGVLLCIGLAILLTKIW